MFKKENRIQFIIYIFSLAILNTVLYCGIVKNVSIVKSIIDIFISVQLLGIFLGLLIALIPFKSKTFLDRFYGASLIVMLFFQSVLIVVNIVFLFKMF